MCALHIAAIVCMVSMVTAELGFSNADEWAFQWYEGESFKFVYEDDRSLYVTWETPNKEMVSETSTHDNYEATDIGTVKNGALLIKDITASTHGVYFCNMYDAANRTHLGRNIFGLNIREVKYRNMSDKYNHNLAVAFIVTAVFLVPLLTMCLTYKFQYERRHGYPTSNGATRKFMYSTSEHEMKSTDGLSTTGTPSIDTKEAYDNPNFSTSASISTNM